MSRDSRVARFPYLPVLDPRVSIMPPAQAELWPRLGGIPDHFVLYGGTGLALRLGHRESLDFDFFSAESFLPTELASDLSWLGRVTINQASPNNLILTTENAVNLSFRGAMGIASVAEPSFVRENGLVIASTFDLAGTKAKAILDRSERKDYVDIATLLRHGITVPEMIGYATTIFAPKFEFPAAVFLRSLVWFGDGTASDVPDDIKRQLERAVAKVGPSDIPVVAPYSASILP